MAYNRIMLSALGLGAMLLAGGASYTQDVPSPPVPHDYATDLRARHPEIIDRDDFTSWIDRQHVGLWYETAIDAQKHRKVTVQDLDGKKVFAALVDVADRPIVRQTARVDLAAIGLTRQSAMDASGTQLPAATTIRRARPVVDFTADGKWTFSWEFQVLRNSTLETYRLKEKANLIKVPQLSGRGRASLAARGGGAANLPGGRVVVRGAAPAGAAPAGPPMARGSGSTGTDDLAANELHHPGDFFQEALTWTTGAPTKQDRALKIFNHVRDGYLYDANIPGIAEFTWSDLLTRDTNDRSGVCDEISVVAVSYLRALGIKSRLKILTWSQPGEKDAVQHEALEYEDDGGQWRHFDAVWLTFNDPTVYRKQGAQNLTVLDATFPLDTRSSVPAWGFMDPNGDGRLHPYFDFLLVPVYPGKGRAGYSY